MAKCDTVTQQCKPCTGVGCVTKAQCDQSCGLARAKCNTKTKQCESCTDATDPDCVTKGQCDDDCAKSIPWVTALFCFRRTGEISDERPLRLTAGKTEGG